MKIIYLLLFSSCNMLQYGHFARHEIIEDSININGRLYHTYKCVNPYCEWKDTFPIIIRLKPYKVKL